jgi:MFS family permease
VRLVSFPAAHSDAPPRWVNAHVLRIIAVQVVFGFAWSLYLLVPKFLAEELHAGPEIIGKFSVASGIAGLCTVPFAGRGLDRFGRLAFFRAGALLVVGLSVGFLFVDEVSWAVYFLQGAVAAAFVLAFNATAALLTDYTPPQRIGQAIGFLGGANVMMNAVATMVAEPLAMQHGWHTVFWLGIVVGSLSFALSFSLREVPTRPRVLPVTSSRKGGLHREPIVGILLATSLIGAVFAAMFIFVQPFALSLGAKEVRQFFLGFTISAVFCRVGLGGLGDRFGRRNVSILMTFGYGLSALLTAWLDPQQLMLYGLAFGFAHGLLYPTLNALVLEVMPASRRGLGMVLYNGAFNAGTAGSGLAWGFLAHERGYPSVYMVACGAAFVAAIVLLLGRRSSPA